MVNTVSVKYSRSVQRSSARSKGQSSAQRTSSQNRTPLVVNQSRRRQYFHTDQWAASYSRATLAA